MRTISSDLREVFSVLPSPYSKKAPADFLRTFRDDHTPLDTQLKWADFDKSGRFLNGGSLDVRASSSHIMQPENDPDLRKLCNEIAAIGPTPGRVSSFPPFNRMGWQIPFPENGRRKHAKAFIRALSIPYALFRDIVTDCNEDAGLAEAEINVAFQILIGLSLREAATINKVSIETKRTQLKAVCNKLQCGGQKELVTILTGHLVHLVSLCDAEMRELAAIQSFVAGYLDKQTRVNQYVLCNGRVLRTIESGPSAGRPIILLHSMMYPLFIAGTSNILEKAGIKLITPVRRGYLEGSSASELFDRHDLVDQSLEDLATHLQESDIGPLPIVGQSFGAALAIKFAAKHSSLVSQICLVSIMCKHGGYAPDGFFGRWSQGLRGLIYQPSLLRLISWHFMKYYRMRKTTRDVMLRMFGNQESDRIAFERSNGHQNTYEMFNAFHRTSYIGFADDVREFAQENVSTQLRDLPPTHFIHGECDPLVALEKVQSLIRPGTDTLTVINQAGHFSYGSHQDEVWAALIDHII